MTDEEAREHIYKDLKENYFVEASAGSGKTTSLVYRMVALVESGVPVNEICTITFTKAAADEFFARFQHDLSIRSVPLKPGEEEDIDKVLGSRIHMDLCQKALADIDSCFLGTTDSFLNMVAHEMPNEIKIPSDSEIINEETRELIIKDEFNNILTNDKDPLHEYALKFYTLISYSTDAFIKGVKLVSDNRHLVMDYDPTLLDIDEHYFDAVKKDFLDIVSVIASTTFYHPTNGAAELARKRMLRLVKRNYNLFIKEGFVDHLDEIQKTINAILKYTGVERKNTGVENNNKFSEDNISSASPAFTALLEKSKKSYVFNNDVEIKMNNMLEKVDNHLHTLFFHVAINAEQKIRKTLKNAGLFTFNDFLFYVRDAFKESASTDRVLVDQIYSRHKYFLLDENQDTNPVQTELFFYIAGTNPEKDWTKIVLKPGSIFIVGDPKQSIYGFRGADVQAYKLTRDYFVSKKGNLLLTKNFRSIVSLKDWFNAVMDDLLNHDEDALPHPTIPIDNKERIAAIKGTKPNNDKLLDGVYSYDTLPTKDADYVARLIKEITTPGKNKIISKNKTKDKVEKEQYPLVYRDVSYEDILVIPTKTDVKSYIKSFSEFDIPFVVEASIPFDKSESLVSLTKLVLFLKDPTDKGTFLNLLISPLYNLNDLDITSMVNDGFKFSIFNANPTLVKNSHYHIIEELNRLSSETKGMSYSSTMLYILNDPEFKLLLRVNSEFLEYTYFLIEKIKEREEAGLLSGAGQLAEYMDKVMRGGGDQKESRVLRFRNKVNRVKIANLHKVKGLQAPIVILINPNVKHHEADSFTDITTSPFTMLNRKVSEFDDNFIVRTYAQTHKYSKTITDRWERGAQAERDRVAYVAATRAESVLIIAHSTKTASNYYDPWVKLSTRVPQDVTHVLPDVSGISAVSKTPIAESYKTAVINNDSSTASVKYKTPSTGKVFAINNNDDEIKKTTKDATLVGTLVHKLLELIVSSNNGYKDVKVLVSAITKQYVGGNQYIDLLERVANTFINGGFKQKNSTIKDDLLSVLLNAEEVYCETPFSYRKDDTIINGVIDLLYKDDKGYHVIDYKTNKLDDVSILEKEYKNQLQDYINALKEMGIDSDAHIYHIAVE